MFHKDNTFSYLFTVDRTSIDKTLKKLEKIEVHQVKEFCVPSSISQKTDLKTFQPELCAFNVSETVLNLLPELQSCSDSSTFMTFWIAECQSVMDDSPTLDDTVPQVWNTVKARLLLSPLQRSGSSLFFLYWSISRPHRFCSIVPFDTMPSHFIG